MEASTRHSLVRLLQEYWDVFTFGPEEMPGIDLAVMKHRLNVDPLHKPVIQKKRHMGPEKVAATATEVQKLLKVLFVRECQYPE